MQAIADSIKAPHQRDANPGYHGGDAIIWGMIRGAPELIKAVKNAGRDYWHVDNGYFGRNKYFRITKNANQFTSIEDRPPGRFEQFNIEFKPWTTSGKKIVLALSSEWLFKFYKDDIEKYTKRTVEELRKHTKRPITIRPKDAKYPIEEDLKDCYALVTHTSNCALDALRAGVPVFTTGLCSAAPLALQDLSKIETPIYPEREKLFNTLAWHQFTVEELRKGMWKDA